MTRPAVKSTGSTDAGRGYSPLADEILAALQGCEAESEVDRIAQEYAQQVRDMNADPDLRVRVTHIRNLAALKRRELRRGRDV